MNSNQLEAELMNLSRHKRGELAKKLLLSLDNEKAADHEHLWLAEARQRAEDIDNGKVTAIDADTVMEKAKSLLR